MVVQVVRGPIEELSTVSATAERIGQKCTNVKYNHCILQFLKDQVVKLQVVISEHAEVPENYVQMMNDNLEPWLSSSEPMVQRHADPLELEKLYTVNKQWGW